MAKKVNTYCEEYVFVISLLIRQNRYYTIIAVIAIWFIPCVGYV